MKKTEQGIIHWVVIIVGIILILCLLGVFSNNHTLFGINTKAILRLPCGITVSHPNEGDHVKFPLVVDGFANNCGWSVVAGTAGTAQVFDGHGVPMTEAFPLSIDSSNSAPYGFSANLPLRVPPQTDTGSIILKSNTGLIHAIQIVF